MAATLDLVRDLLDAQLVDSRQHKLGRVDGVVLELRSDRPPRVAAMEVGLFVAARRVHPRVERLLRALLRRMPFRPATVRLPLELFKDIGTDIELDLDAQDDSPAVRRLMGVERWMRHHIVCRLPHAGTK